MGVCVCVCVCVGGGGGGGGGGVFRKSCLFTLLMKIEPCCESLNHYSSDAYVIRGARFVVFQMDLSLPAMVLKVNVIDELIIMEQYMVS